MCHSSQAQIHVQKKDGGRDPLFIISIALGMPTHSTLPFEFWMIHAPSSLKATRFIDLLSLIDSSILLLLISPDELHHTLPF